MDEPSSTQIKVNEDSPTAVSSQAHGANVDALAFNITLIASRNPTLAVQIMKLYDEAKQVSVNDPPHPEEDFALALNDLPDPFDKN